MTANGDDVVEQQSPSTHFKDALARVTAYAQEAMDEIVRSKGEIMRELGALNRLSHGMSLRLERVEDKLDAHIGDVRTYLAETRVLRLEVRDSIRPKLDSLHDQEETVTEITHTVADLRRKDLDAEKSRKLRLKAVRRLLMAAALGAAGAIGAAAGVSSIRDCATHMHP